MRARTLNEESNVEASARTRTGFCGYTRARPHDRKYCTADDGTSVRTFPVNFEHKRKKAREGETRRNGVERFRDSRDA